MRPIAFQNQEKIVAKGSQVTQTIRKQLRLV